MEGIKKSKDEGKDKVDKLEGRGKKGLQVQIMFSLICLLLSSFIKAIKKKALSYHGQVRERKDLGKEVQQKGGKM